MALPIQTFRSSPFKGINEKVSPHLLDDGESPSCKGVYKTPLGSISKQKGYTKWITDPVTVDGKIEGIANFKVGNDSLVVAISNKEFYKYIENGTGKTQITGQKTVLVSCDEANKTIYIYHYGGSYDLEDGKSSFTVAHNPSGVAWDGTNLWSCDQTANKLYKHSGLTSTILAEYPAPSGMGISGLCYDGTDLWACGYSDNKVCKVNIATGVFTYVFTVASDVGSRLTSIVRKGEFVWVTVEIIPKIAKYTLGGTFCYSFLHPISIIFGSWEDVTMSSDGKYQTAVVSGGLIYISSDYGNNWVAKETIRKWEDVTMSSDGKYQTAVVYTGLIYISSNYGVDWVAKETIRNWEGIAMSSDGKYQTAVVWNGLIYISSDYGNNWVAKETIRKWEDVTMSSDGKYQTAVVYTGLIYISSNYGVDWVAKETIRNWEGIAMSSDGKYQTAVVLSGYIYISTDYGNNWIVSRPTGVVFDSDDIMLISNDFYKTIYKTDCYGVLLSTIPATISLSGLEYIAILPATLADGKFDFAVFQDNLLFCNGTDKVFKWSGTGNFTAIADSRHGSKYLAVFNNYLLTAGHNDSDVCWSNLLDSDVGYADNYLTIDPDSGDKITGLINYSNVLIVFKENSKWRVSFSGDYDLPFYVSKIDDIGAISHHSLIVINNRLYFCAKDGVYVFDSASSTKLSDKMDSVYKNFIGGNRETIDVVYIPELNEIRWTIQGAVDYSTIAYNLLSNDWIALDDVNLADWVSSNFCSLIDKIIASAKNYIIKINDGYSFDTQVGTSRKIYTDVKTKVFDFGIPSKEKKIKKGYFVVKKENEDNDITLSVSVDGKSYESLPPIKVFAAGGGERLTQTIDLGEKVGKQFQFNFVNFSEAQFTEYEYMMEYQVLPRTIQ